MPPGPSQQGRFKPRKPAKKIRVGASVVPDAAPSAITAAAAAESTTAAAAAAATAAASTGRGGRDGRGGGRGGRSGRGRRAPVIQGRGFFVGVTSSGVDPQTAKANAKGKKGAKGGADDPKGALVAKRKDESTEEIVGTMDKAIGSSLGEEGGGKRSVLDEYNDGDFTGPSKFDNEEEGGGHFNEAGIFYDSDSSLEETKPKHRNNNIRPLRLPFPVAPLPVGIGAKEDVRASMYLDPEDENNMTTTTVSESDRPSPFVDPTNKAALKQEMNSFFLFQFPTRLPPLLQQNAPSSKKESSQGEDQEMAEAEAEIIKEEEEAPIPSTLPSTTAEVVTPPTKPGSFDNSMTGAIPGRLGKLVVYKSGKTVLVLQGIDGSSEIRMNVTEGLTCGFDQQAVLIDEIEGRYVKLGSVHKTVVVTPDLGKAFAK